MKNILLLIYLLVFGCVSAAPIAVNQITTNSNPVIFSGTGVTTNANGTLTINSNASSGGGSGFPLTSNVNGGGFTISNASFTGNGAGLTSLHAKRTFKPIDYGADPTHTVDSTTAFQAAINDATQTNKGGIVEVTPGWYLINGLISISNTGSPSFNSFPLEITGYNGSSLYQIVPGTDLKTNSTSIVDFEPTNSLFNYSFQALGVGALEIDHMLWQCDLTNAKKWPLAFINCAHNIHDCSFQGATNLGVVGVTIGNPLVGTVSGITNVFGTTNEFANSYPGIMLNDSWVGFYTEIWCGTASSGELLMLQNQESGGGGAAIICSAPSPVDDLNNIVIFECEFQESVPYDIILTNTFHVNIQGSQFDDGTSAQMAGVLNSATSTSTTGNSWSKGNTNAIFVTNINAGSYTSYEGDALTSLPQINLNGPVSIGGGNNLTFSYPGYIHVTGSASSQYIQPSSDGRTLFFFPNDSGDTIQMQEPLTFNSTNGPIGNGSGLTSLPIVGTAVTTNSSPYSLVINSTGGGGGGIATSGGIGTNTYLTNATLSSSISTNTILSGTTAIGTGGNSGSISLSGVNFNINQLGSAPSGVLNLGANGGVNITSNSVLSGNGFGLTNLAEANIVNLFNGTNTWTGTNTFTNIVIATNAGNNITGTNIPVLNASNSFSGANNTFNQVTVTNSVNITNSITAPQINFKAGNPPGNMEGSGQMNFSQGTTNTWIVEDRTFGTAGGFFYFFNGLANVAQLKLWSNGNTFISGDLTNGGVYYGNGGGLTNLQSSQLVGQQPPGTESTNDTLLNSNNILTGTNSFTNRVSVSNSTGTNIVYPTGFITTVGGTAILTVTNGTTTVAASGLITESGGFNMAYVGSQTQGRLPGWAGGTTGQLTNTSLSASGSTITNTGLIVSSSSFASYSSNKLAPLAISFPATTVPWTNTNSFNVEVYINNPTVTGTGITKNGTTIFTSVTGDCTIGLQPGETFSETYTVGTPTATYSPR